MTRSHDPLPHLASGAKAGRARVTKKIAPDQPGAQWLQRRFGATLVCVRYRRDDAAKRRYTTVEVLVDEGPVRTSQRPDDEVIVFVLEEEVELCRALKYHGATWLPRRKAWKLPKRLATRLGLQRRIIPPP